MGLFKWDSPLMQGITRAFEYMFIWILCLIFCIPIVTIGASITAQFTMSMRLVRGEDCPIFSGFLKAFAQNFKQATIIWIIELLIGATIYYNWNIVLFTNEGVRYKIYFYVLIVFSVLYLMTVVSSFPLMARFNMTNVNVLRGSLVFGLINIPKMAFIFVLIAAPVVLTWYRMQWAPGVLPITATASLYVISAIYVKSFKKTEDRVNGVTEENKEDNTEEAGDEILSAREEVKETSKGIIEQEVNVNLNKADENSEE